MNGATSPSRQHQHIHETIQRPSVDSLLDELSINARSVSPVYAVPHEYALPSFNNFDRNF